MKKNLGWGNCEVCGEKNFYTSKLCQCGAILPWVKPSWGNCAHCGEPYPYDFKRCQCGEVLPWAGKPALELQKLATNIISGFTLRSVEGHRKKFREGPVGGWSGVDVVWQFNANGTGWYQPLAGFSPPGAPHPISWKLEAPFTIWLKQFPCANEDDDSEDEELYPWVKVRYDFGFKLIPYHGKELFMVDVLPDGMLADGFAMELLDWLGPVTYSRPKETSR